MLSFGNIAQQRSRKKWFLPTVEIKDHNVMINVENFFGQPIENKE